MINTATIVARIIESTIMIDCSSVGVVISFFNAADAPVRALFIV